MNKIKQLNVFYHDKKVGRLLVDRFLLQNNINPMETRNLNRLAIVGESGMGALTYRPDFFFLHPFVGDILGQSVLTEDRIGKAKERKFI